MKKRQNRAILPFPINSFLHLCERRKLDPAAKLQELIDHFQARVVSKRRRPRTIVVFKSDLPIHVADDRIAMQTFGESWREVFAEKTGKRK